MKTKLIYFITVLVSCSGEIYSLPESGQKQSQTLKNHGINIAKATQPAHPNPILEAQNAVVEIIALREQEVFNPFLQDPIFSRFFRNFLAPPLHFNEDMIPNRISASGSGVVVSPQGYILTCNHIIDNAEEIQVRFADKKSYDAQIIYSDPKKDLVLLKINKKADTLFPYINIAQYEHKLTADTVYTIGYPFGMGLSITKGVVSSSGRTWNGRNFLQTDAAMNPGNSGGGLFNEEGQLIGIANAIISRSGASHGYGLAIPSGQVITFLRRALSPQHQKDFLTLGINVERCLEGVVVKTIDDHSNLLKVGDIIVAINDRAIQSKKDFEEEEQNLDGTAIKMTVLRDNEKIELDVSPQKIQSITKLIKIRETETLLDGSEVIDNPSKAMKQHYGIDDDQNGIYIVQSNRRAQWVGKRIVELNGKQIHHIEDLEEALKSCKQTIGKRSCFSIKLKSSGSAIEETLERFS